MKVELKTDKSSTDPDDTAILAARGDYMSKSVVGKSIEDVMEGTDKTKREFIEDKLRKGHFGVFEHPTAYFAVEEISRTAMAQVTRHRHQSFDVQSQRYVNFSGKEAIIPPSFEEHEREDWRLPNGNAGSPAEALEQHWAESVKYYDMAVGDGIPKEDARFFLPQATPVNLTFSANPRSLMHFQDLRNSGAAQWEAREFAQQVLDECLEWAPLTFEGYQKHINHNSLRAP